MGYSYTIRLPANDVLSEKIAHRLLCPVEWPSLTKVMRVCEDFAYQAASWDKERRVIAIVEWHSGELFSPVGFIVANLPMEPDGVVGYHNKRGTTGRHIKEGKNAFHATRLPHRRFRDNEGRRQLPALDYSLATLLGCIELPTFNRSDDRRHRARRKSLVQRANSGDLAVKRQATWGMSREHCHVAILFPSNERHITICSNEIQSSLPSGA